MTISDSEQADLVAHLLAGYRLTLTEDRRVLFDRFTEVDTVRQVVGVGSVGMRVYLMPFEGRSGAHPLFLRVKQAGPSVYEAYMQPATGSCRSCAAATTTTPVASPPATGSASL